MKIAAHRMKNALDKAILNLKKLDWPLLKHDANERSITHKLAEYLAKEFREWDVDCEYNRNRHQIKELILSECRTPETNDTDARTVFPDIIVHKRDSDDNQIVIEVKKNTNPSEDKFDNLKLREFRAQLNYKYTIFLRLRTGSAAVRDGGPTWTAAEGKIWVVEA